MHNLVLGLLFVACTVEATDRSGIAVGNPPGKEEGEAMARVTVANGDGVRMVDFNMAVDGVYLEDCNGTGMRIDYEPGTILRLDGTSIPIPTGEWCLIGLQPTLRATHLRGTAGEGRFRFEATLGRIFLFARPGNVLLDGDTLVLELAEPGWLTPEDFDVRGDEEVVVGGADCLDDRLCDQIRRGLMNRAGLYRDPDRDGQVDESERDAGSQASGDERREDTREP